MRSYFVRRKQLQWSSFFLHWGVETFMQALPHMDCNFQWDKVTRHPKYHTKGCHNKWYRGWRMPCLTKQDPRFNQTFVRLVGQEFCDILVDRGWLKARASSDSTVSSEDYANIRNESLEEDLNCMELSHSMYFLCICNMLSSFVISRD